jgi:hypothetical protein
MKITISAPLTAALLLAALFLAGCDTLNELRPETIKQKYGWTEEKMVAKGWLHARFIPAQTTYCYRTIGIPECFPEPQPGQETRLIGYIKEDIAY